MLIQVGSRQVNVAWVWHPSSCTLVAVHQRSMHRGAVARAMTAPFPALPKKVHIDQARSAAYRPQPPEQPVHEPCVVLLVEPGVIKQLRAADGSHLAGALLRPHPRCRQQRVGGASQARQPGSSAGRILNSSKLAAVTLRGVQEDARLECSKGLAPDSLDL